MTRIFKVAFFSLLLLATDANANQIFEIEWLGISGQPTQAGAINDFGDVVVSTLPGNLVGNEIDGYDLDPPGAVWKIAANGQTIELLGLGGPQDQAFDLNDSGVAVGFSQTTFLTSPRQSIIWDGLSATALPVIPNVVGLTQALSVNNKGQILVTNAFDGRRVSFVYSEQDGYTPLPIQEGMTTGASDINDDSQVVGSFSTANPNSPFKSSSFLWQNGTLTDLGGLGGNKSSAAAINNVGQVVGTASTSAESLQHTYIWNAENGIEDLGTLLGLHSVPIDINDSGVVIGRLVDNEDVSIPYLYDKANGMRLLGDLLPSEAGFSNSFGVVGINNRGQILGTALFGGVSQAFLLNPIPEPSSFILIAAGTLGILVRRQ